MLLGMMVVGTSASYADVASKDNKEAIEVLQAVGIMTGDDKGNFNPDQKVTRNEMAVVMCNLLDFRVASYTGSTKFTDVPAWAEPYVAACYTNKIIAGYSATTFGGSDTVTTAQAALMLMKALDYFQYPSDFSDDWQLATIRQGNKISLFDDVDASAQEAMTRNDVAQLVLNALKAYKADVTVSGNNTSISAGDVTVKVDVNATYTESNKTLMKDLFDDDLEHEVANDVAGRPATKWTYKDDEIGTYGKEADKTYVAKKGDKTVEYYLSNSDYLGFAADRYAHDTVKVNNENANNTTALNKGDVIEVYYYDAASGDAKKGDVEYVTVLRYETAIIDDIDTDVTKNQKDDGVNAIVTLKDIDDNEIGKGDYYDTIKASASSDEKENQLVGFVGNTYKKGAAIAVAMNNSDEIIDSYVLTVVSGKPSSARDAEAVGNSDTRIKNGYVKIDGTTYNFAGAVDGTTSNFDFDKEYKVYVTAQGYVLAVNGNATVSLDDVYYVSGVYKVSGNYGKETWYAQAVLLSDGTVKDIKIDSDFVSAADAAGFNNMNDVLAVSNRNLMKADGTLTGTQVNKATNAATAEEKTLYVTNDYLYTFDKDGVPSVYDGENDYDITINALTNDAKKSDGRITVGGTRYYVDSTTKYVGVEDYGDDLDVSTAVGGMSAKANTSVVMVCDGRDAKVVVYVAQKLHAAQESVVYVTETPNEKNTDGYVATIYFMDGNKSEKVTLDKAYGAGFYTYSINSDGVYELTNDTALTTEDLNDDATEGFIVGAEFTSRGGSMVSGSFTYGTPATSQSFTDVEFGKALILDDDKDNHKQVYDREINSVSRLQSAIDAIKATSTTNAGKVTADIYVTDGEITFVYVTGMTAGSNK